MSKVTNNKESIVLGIIKEITKLRKIKKHEWYLYANEQYGIYLDGYRTWIQTLRVGTLKDGSPADMKVKDFNNWLYERLMQGIKI